MDKTSTLEKLASFTQNEKQLLAEIGFEVKDQINGPSKGTVDTILNYSKAISIRPSKITGHIEMMLN